MRNINQRGFAILQMILLVVLAGMIGGTGYYVYNAQKETNKSLDSANKNLQQLSERKDTKETPTETRAEDSWLKFETADYSVRIPDGWQGISLGGNIYARDPAKMKYTEGTKAVIETLEEGGWDGASPFALYVPRQGDSEMVREGTKQSELKTEQGLTVQVHKYVQTTEPDGIGYQKGDTVYLYYFDADGKYLHVSHVVSQGGEDHSALVERLVKTVVVK